MTSGSYFKSRLEIISEVFAKALTVLILIILGLQILLLDVFIM